MKAVWKDQILAESNETIVIERNHYFPPESLNQELMEQSDHTSVCGWKGLANYYTVVVDGQRNENAAWYYADPKPKAENIKGYVAFWRGVKVV